MRLKLATLCDYASVSESGKLNILGIFSSIWARTAPITHTQMHLVVQFEFDFLDRGKKEMQVALVNEDGKEIMKIGGQLDVPPTSGIESANVNQIFVFNNTTFPQFGEYEFRVLLDDETQAVVPVRVEQMQESGR